MPGFPKTEVDITSFAERMAKGLWEYWSDFPSVNKMLLLAKMSQFANAKKDLDDKKSAAFIATGEKDRLFKELCRVMKNDLRKSEVDTKNNPEKLALIGWGVKAAPSPTLVPASPTDLTLVRVRETTVRLNWDRPADSVVRNYIIERRQQQTDGTFGPWQLTATSFKREVTLTNQPKAVKLEYRVKAVNLAGVSFSTNSVSVVL